MTRLVLSIFWMVAVAVTTSAEAVSGDAWALETPGLTVTPSAIATAVRAVPTFAVLCIALSLQGSMRTASAGAVCKLRTHARSRRLTRRQPVLPPIAAPRETQPSRADRDSRPRGGRHAARLATKTPADGFFASATGARRQPRRHGPHDPG